MRSAQVHQRAILANSGVISAASLIGGSGADVFQLYALKVLELSPAIIGGVLTIQLFSIPVQLFAAGASVRTPNRTMMIRSYIMLLGVLAAFLVVPGIRELDSRLGIVMLAVAVLAGECAMSYGWGTAWMSWMQSITSPGARGPVLSDMRFVAHSVGLLFIGLVAALSRGNFGYSSFTVATLVIGLYLCGAIALYRTIPDPSCEARLQTTVPTMRLVPRLLVDIKALATAVHELRYAAGVRRLALTATLVELLGTPLFLTYMISGLQLSAPTAAVLVTVKQAAALFSLPLWGRVVRHNGSATTGRVLLGLFAATSMLWPLVTADRVGGPFGLVGLALLFIVSSTLLNGIGIAVLTEAHSRIPESHSGVAFSIYDLISSSLLQLTYGIGGVLISLSAVSPFIATGLFNIDAYNLFLLVCGIAAIAAAWSFKPERRSVER